MKIETLKVESESEHEEEDEHEINEETGEMVRIKKSDNSGPWNKVASTNANEESSPEKEIEAKPAPTKTEEAAPSGKKSYVPPHMRGGGGSATTELERRPMSGRTGRKKCTRSKCNKFPVIIRLGRSEGWFQRCS